MILPRFERDLLFIILEVRVLAVPAGSDIVASVRCLAQSYKNQATLEIELAGSFCIYYTLPFHVSLGHSHSALPASHGEGE